MLFFQYGTSSMLLLPAVAIASSNNGQVDVHPWQNRGPHANPGYFLGEVQSALSTMQSTFWNGTYWPSTLQWVGAFLNTLVVGSERSSINALDGYDGSQSSTELQRDVAEYWADVESYYGGEDTIQIFGAAFDDAQWVVLEWLDAINLINRNTTYAQSDAGQSNIARFAHRAHIFYNIVQNQFDTSLCNGGITWNPELAPYKNAITNQLFLSSSVAMYLYFPGDADSDPYPSTNYTSRTNATLPPLPPLAARDPILLDNAKKEWSWFQSHNFTNPQGLVVDGFHISDNQTTCDQRNEMVYTYNQGVMLSGLRLLWEATGDYTYLSDGYGFVKTTIQATGWNANNSSQAGEWAGLGRNGIMEDYCDAPANCSQDAQVFKGIYYHHLQKFCAPLPTSTSLIANLTYLASPSLAAQHAGECQSYVPWIQHNAYAALQTENSSGVFGGWWGASYLNKTQQPWPQWAKPPPAGSWDVRNEPSLLDISLWRCNPADRECASWVEEHRGVDRRGGIGFGGGTGDMKRMLQDWRQKRDPDNQGRGRTVETHGAGLGVVKAAAGY